jgi:phage tail-like protein
MSVVELPALYVDNVALVEGGPQLVLLNRQPCPGETGVPIDATLALELLDTGVDGVDAFATRVWVDGALAFDGSAPNPVTPGFSGGFSGVTQSADTLRITLRPVVPLESLRAVTVRVVSRTVGGVATLDEVYSFEVEDRTAPRVVGAQAVAPRMVRVGFDEPVAWPDGATVSLTPMGAPAVPVAVVGGSVDSTVVMLQLDTEMTPDVEYVAIAQGVTDLSGNPVLPPYNQATFTGFRPAQPPGRRFQLWEMLPKHNRRDDETGDLRRFIACLQEVVDLLLAGADAWPDIFDLERAPEGFLEAILQDLGNPFPFELDTLGKRRLASVLVEMYRQKGTAKGIRNAIRFFLGIDVSAISAFAGDALVLGESELGVDWTLGPSARFARYAFDIEVGRALTEKERRQLRAIVDYLKPAHTRFIDLLEPQAPVVSEYWELGIGELGDATRLN